jgi:sigma-B regulation protein RsbU (phosphoserine phosphatase)
MTEREEIEKNPWKYIDRLIARKLTFLQIGANLIGACIVTSYFMFFDQTGSYRQINKYITFILIMFIGLVIIGSVLQRNWLKDLNRFVRLKNQNQEVGSGLHKRVQRKMLDLPYICSLTSLFNWCLATFIMSVFRILNPNVGETFAVRLFEASRVFIGVIISGIVTSAIIFFSVEIFCRRIWPYFFPYGGLVKTPGAFRLRLRLRMLIIFVLASVLPIILMAVLSYNKARMMLIMDSAEVIQSLLYLTGFLLAVTLAMTIILSRLFTTSIVTPVSQMERAMAKVEQGDLTASVPVNSNDELGALADHFNQMTVGLKERYELRRSLDLAREVQQNLLPKENPVVEGLDVAGKSIYCDETGGDYFDFLKNDELGDDKFGVVIGDVSEHGIPSALLMASARAFIRQRSALTGSIARVVMDVNQQLTRDVEDTGRFMTLFYLLIDLNRRHLHWVRAGHDPAILYDPANDRFEEMGGEGLALGINDAWSYQEYEKSSLTEGQIILLSTDGLWEAQNPQGEMFGKSSIYEIIRRNASANAKQLLDAIIEELTRFQKTAQTTDDITLVIIKLKSGD